MPGEKFTPVFEAKKIRLFGGYLEVKQKMILHLSNTSKYIELCFHPKLQILLAQNWNNFQPVTQREQNRTF